MNIVILDGHTCNPGDLSWAPFEMFGTVTVYDRTPPELVLERMAGAQAVITNKVRMTREIMESCPCLTYIGVTAAGYDIIDIEAAAARGVTVTNTPGYGTNGVAQFTIALLLELCSHVALHDRAVHEGRWAKAEDWCFWDRPLVELAGKTIGIVGFGHIGQAVGRIASALGMRVLAHARSRSEEGARIAQYVPLDTLFAESDVISLHCPLTPETRGLVNKHSITTMKDGVIILNTARGPLIEEKDLADALNTGKVQAAGLDVVSVEPIDARNPLLEARNCVITPHIAWAAQESRQRILDITLQNLKGFVEGSPRNVVSK